MMYDLETRTTNKAAPLYGVASKWFATRRIIVFHGLMDVEIM